MLVNYLWTKYPVVLRSSINSHMKKLILILLVSAISLNSQSTEPDRWQKISQSVFPNSVITEDSRVISLATAARADDAAIVPVSIHSGFPQTSEHYVTDIWLIIDQNPSPVAAHFRFTKESGQADIETRVRINEYTLIRAVARVSDGKYYQSQRFIKASGGCSAPAAKDPAASGIGRIKLADLSAVPGRPLLLQAQIRHPNDSGLAMDQLTRNYAPAYYVRHMRVSYADHDIMTADLDISISENPEFQFYSANSDVTVSFTDNTDQTWSAHRLH